MVIKKIIFKVGGSVEEDLREIQEGTRRPEGDTLTIHVLRAEDIPPMMAPEKIRQQLYEFDMLEDCPGDDAPPIIGKAPAHYPKVHCKQVAIELA
ncbi:MAG: hypothetical protein AABW68_00740 [archaeon]